VIALKNEEKDQQNDERGRFEESNAEQALIHQHDALPPAFSGRRREKNTPASLARDETRPSPQIPLTLTCYFLNGQAHRIPTVPSRIMALGAKHSWS
jgi:hypothetical protein